MSASALRAVGVRRSFGGVRALDGVSFDVPRGTIAGLLGPNGAGKTTLLRILLGLLRPDDGSVEVLGEGLEGGRASPLLRVGSLVESPTLYDHLTGRENLLASCSLRGRAAARADDLLERLGLHEAAGRRVAGYSLGMKQRLGIGLALLGEPELLLLDEPTNGLDPAGFQEVRALLRDLCRDQGVTVLLSSHLLSEIEQLASHLIVLDRGRRRFEGTVEELQASLKTRTELGVDDPERAAVVLARKGWSCEVASDSLLVAASGREERASVCSVLVKSGCAVHQLVERAASLETAFLELVEQDEGDPR
ncbi:MAG: ATP-binding cassette domain-containing protein [Acidobacteriota bacterium]